VAHDLIALITPLSGIVCQCWASTCYTINISAKFKFLPLSAAKIIKVVENVENVENRVVLGS